MPALPKFMLAGGEVDPPAADAPIQSVGQAIEHFREAGDTVKADNPGPDKETRWCLTHRGWSHGGVPDEGLIHIANEDVARRAKNAARRKRKA